MGDVGKKAGETLCFPFYHLGSGINNFVIPDPK